jgi:hypothetical protein
VTTLRPQMTTLHLHATMVRKQIVRDLCIRTMLQARSVTARIH